LSLRSLVFRRRILCSIISRSRMLSAPKPVRDDLEISYRSKKLDDPYVVTIEISNVGRAPVLGEHFTQGRALEFQIDAPILRILTVEHKPESAPQPSIVAHEGSFGLKPELLVKGEAIRASLLTEGEPGNVRVHLNPFGDIAVQLRDREAWLRQRNRRVSLTILIMVPVISAVALATSFASTHLARQELARARTAAGSFACANLIESSNNAGTAFESVYVSMRVPVSNRTKDTVVHFINNAKTQSDLLVRAYRTAADAGIVLGKTARIPTMSEGVAAVLVHSRARLRRITKKELDLVHHTASLLNSKQALPPACQF